MSIATPEGLELELVLAGAGSRFTAGLVDLLLQVLIVFAAFFVLAQSDSGSGFLIALFFLVQFGVWFGYHILFEVAAAGRTPGKRWTGLRVVGTDGSAVGIGSSVVRNLLRVVDMLPGPYLVGILLVALTKRHQRLGDMVGGTVVVRERREVATPRGEGNERRIAPELAAWDVSAITAEEEATVRRFLERRDDIDLEARNRLAEQLATRLRPKVVGDHEHRGPEGFLQDLVDARSLRR